MKVAAVIIFGIALVIAWVAFIAWVLMVAWNAVIPDVFGLTAITFLQALALILVVHILLGILRVAVNR